MGFKALLTYARPYRGSLLLVAFLSLACAAALLSLPWITGQLLGELLGAAQAGDGSNALSSALLLTGGLCVLAIMQMACAITSAAVGTRIEAAFKGDIFAHVQRLPMAYLDRKQQGDLLALLTSEFSLFGILLTRFLAATPTALLAGIGAAVALFQIDQAMALLAMVLLPMCFMLQRLIGRELRGLSIKIQIAEAEVFAAAESNLEMLPAAKAFASEDSALVGYRQVIEKLRRLKLRRRKVIAVLTPAIMLIAGLGSLFLLLLAHQRLGIGQANPAAFFTFVLYVGLLVYAMHTSSRFMGRVSMARGSLERLNHVLAKAAEPGYAMPLLETSCAGWISFSNVWFGYPGQQEVLRGAQFDIEAGETVVLAGENGAGKSTILALLLALYQPRNGRIKIDGCDIAQMNLQQLRRQIGYVPQHPLLQDGTVLDNLTMRQSGFSQADVQRACKLAQAHDFIMQLPNGYRTQIGNRGVALSGSQRQRLAIARALLAEPSILVLDEATSHFTPEDEAAFVEAHRLGQIGCTTIIVSHRRAMLALADRVLTIKDGKVSEIGRRGTMRDPKAASATIIIDQPG
ncbi:ABC transporter ATP-binding protein [Aurantiacibacter rhizosphaerae]|uniref:ATP-binding cassette domain-containing protein n=1 Tax=Aurantiacibacter rhizosphaerae TaxID=2691582 RepID=A0A844XGU8_9SPHN|nr:ABC transporter ATP-binding protein [Aurantiacibacter rhizosphaerae]MWV28953.1 ATP-binding cassette domain-containing protein [Aurantiacibacter rhizosphaerae]